MIYSNELGYECLEMICFSKDHEVLHGCWVKWSCGFFNMFQHCHSQPIFVNNKSNSRCMGTWASCNLIMDKLLYRLDCFATFIQGHVVCLNTNSSQTGYVVHHIQHSERACMDIHWSQFAMEVIPSRYQLLGDWHTPHPNLFCLGDYGFKHEEKSYSHITNN
jgi:hypothetical protein